MYGMWTWFLPDVSGGDSSFRRDATARAHVFSISPSSMVAISFPTRANHSDLLACFRHRGPSAHACSPPAKTLTPAQAHTRALIANLSSSSTSPASTRKPAVAHKKPINPAIALMKLKQTAKPGRGDVARPERWHLVIGVDLDWKKQGEGEGEATFWKKVEPSILRG
jgi:hypothetical protein